MSASSPARHVLRRLSSAIAAVAALAAGSAAVAGVDLASGTRAAWETEAARNERESGLDIILCMRGTCGSEAGSEDATRVVSAVSRLPGVEANLVGESEIRSSLSSYLQPGDLASIRTPFVIQVTADLPDLERRVRDIAEQDPSVARIQPRNLASRAAAAQLRSSYRTLTLIALLQAGAVAVALAGMVRAHVAGKKDEILLMNLSGVSPRKIRRPYILTAASAGLVAGAAGSLAAQAAVRLGAAPAYTHALDIEGAAYGSVAIAALGAAALAAAVARISAQTDVREIPL